MTSMASRKHSGSPIGVRLLGINRRRRASCSAAVFDPQRRFDAARGCIAKADLGILNRFNPNL
jgi:hypothetical protein